MDAVSRLTRSSWRKGQTMKCDRQTMRLYAVTDRAWVGRQTLPEQVEAALKGGATCVQLREKELDGTALLEEAKVLAALCRRYGVPLIINDNVEVALASGADGVHVGQDDLKVEQVRRLAGDRLIVGVSAHTVEQALAAQAGGADYLGVGAVFATATKSDAHVLPRETLAEICGRWTSPWWPSAASARTTSSSWRGRGWTARPWSAPSSPPRTSRDSAGSCGPV